MDNNSRFATGSPELEAVQLPSSGAPLASRLNRIQGDHPVKVPLPLNLTPENIIKENIWLKGALGLLKESRETGNENTSGSASLGLVIHTSKFIRGYLGTDDSGSHDHRDGNHTHQKMGSARVIRNGLAM